MQMILFYFLLLLVLCRRCWIFVMSVVQKLIVFNAKKSTLFAVGKACDN